MQKEQSRKQSLKLLRSGQENPSLEATIFSLEKQERTFDPSLNNKDQVMPIL